MSSHIHNADISQTFSTANMRPARGRRAMNEGAYSAVAPGHTIHSKGPLAGFSVIKP